MKPEIILASKSPRRLEIFRMFSLDPTVAVSNADETVEEGLSPDKTVERISRIKGEAVKKLYSDNVLVVSADTIVWHGGKALGKPRGRQEAIEMLSSMSGMAHQVWTGYTIFYRGRVISRSVRTDVVFKRLEPSEIEKYVDSGAPFDKAGGYGAQGPAAVFIEKIDGDFFNVVGFPLSDFYDCVKNELGIDLM
jgi:septum formation protein